MKQIQYKVGDFVKCVKEFKSAWYPENSYGEVGKIYEVFSGHTGDHLFILSGNGIVHEWVNKDRFVPTSQATIPVEKPKIYDTIFSVQHVSGEFINTGGDPRIPPSYGPKGWAERLCRGNPDYQVVKFYVIKADDL